MTSRSFGSTRETPWLNPRILTLFTLVFVCGLALGALITREVLHQHMKPHLIGVNELNKQLHLTPEQVQVVDRELDEYAKYYQNIEDDRQDVAAHGKTVIENILTPEQRKIFVEMLTQPGFPLK